MHAQQNYPFSAFGDVFACWVQDLAIIALIVWFTRPNPLLVAVAGGAFVGFAAFMFSGGCPIEVLSKLQVGHVGGHVGELCEDHVGGAYGRTRGRQGPPRRGTMWVRTVWEDTRMGGHMDERTVG